MVNEQARVTIRPWTAFDLAVDRDAEVPIGVQLAWALRARIRDGRFEPGQRLPGLRELAEASASTSTPSAPSTSASSRRD